MRLLRQLNAPEPHAPLGGASVVVLPPRSIAAGGALPQHVRRAARSALRVMQAHPAYRRRAGHDHLLLSNYWDAWGAYGERGTPEHAALANVTLGWHETAAAAWGMANHRHVGKCQISLPYVEPPRCAAQSEASLLARERSAPLFFAGGVDDFEPPTPPSAPTSTATPCS